MYLTIIILNFISYYIFSYFINDKNKEHENNYKLLAYKYKKLKYNNIWIGSILKTSS